MARQRLKSHSHITSFTPDGNLLAVLTQNGVVKIWSTIDGSLSAEWKQSDDDPVVGYSSMACSFVGKKPKKERGTLLLALGTNDGDIFAVDVFTGERKWKSTGCYPGGLAGLAFANKGRSLHAVGINRMVSELESQTGELLGEFKASKKFISSSAFSLDAKLFALASVGIRVLNLENGKEVLKFSDDMVTVQYISISDDGKTIVTSGSGENHLQVWRCDFSSNILSSGPVLSMRHPPLTIECKKGCNEESGAVILALSESGVAYVWHLKNDSKDEEINPTKITVKANKADADQQNGVNVKKSCTSIIATRLNAVETDGRMTALISYGAIDSPQFSLVNISIPGKNIVIAAEDAAVTVQENRLSAGKELEVEAASAQIKKRSKKRAASDPDLTTTKGAQDVGNGEDVDGVLVDDDMIEPTMGEKLANLNLVDTDKPKVNELRESSPAKPPSADSVNILLKQALQADDRALLLECLYTQDKKVIANSVSLLKPADVHKFLQSLVSIIQSRGAVLACALPWLKSLLLQHASGIMSQESSLFALNTLFQLIESRVSTFQSALQISSCLDLLYSGTIDDELEEDAAVTPVIFEDNDESDEEESEDAMDTEEENEEEEAADGIADFEGSDDAMSD